MEIVFYNNFAKKRNSTKRPVVGGTGNPVVDFHVTGHLKEPCSIIHPVISIQNSFLPVADSFFPPAVSTYAYIAKFSRYYWVDDWSFEDGLWTVHMDVDVLASYKTVIGEQTEYILRTNNNDPVGGFNGGVCDTTYPAMTDVTTDQLNFTNPFVNTESQGIYVVGVIGSDDTHAVGAVSYYALTSSEFGDLKETLFGEDGLAAMGLWDVLQQQWLITDVSEQMFKTMYNPFQYIVSCNWFPVDPSDIVGTSVTQMKIGWWTYSVSGVLMSQTVGDFNDSVEEIPSHPQYPRGRYLNHSPYTYRTLYGKFGSIPIDTSFFDIDNPNVSDPYKYLVNFYTVDYITGQCLFQVFASRYSDGTGRKLIHKTEFLIGVPVQLAQIGRDYLGAVSTAIGAGGNIASGALTGAVTGGVAGAIIGGIASAGSGIYNVINSVMPQLETSGVNGSFIGNELSTFLISKFYTIVSEDITHRGRPYCNMARIDTLSGFILCAEGELDLDAYDSERQDIQQFLTEGFFWE